MSSVGSSLDNASELTLPADYRLPHWYAAYICPRHEKRVAMQLDKKAVEHFLPLYQTVHRWKDRRVKVQLPIFPGYVFVHIALQDRLQVLEVPSIVRLVGFQGKPVPLPESEIDLLRNGLVNELRAEPHPYLKVGRRVRIISGPMQGAEGILVRKKDNLRVVLSIDLIMRSVAVEVDASEVEPLSPSLR